MGEKWLYFINILISRFINAGKPNLGAFSNSSEKVRSIIVVKWDEIGDMLTAVHVFELLKQNYPGVEITVLCKPFVSSLIQTDPNVDIIINDVEQWTKRYDLVVELRGTWKSVWKSLGWKTIPKYRVDRGWVRFQQRGKQSHETITNYRIIEPLLPHMAGEKKVEDLSDLVIKPKLYPSANDIVLAQDWVDWALKDDVGVIENVNGIAVLHTGARSDLRRWSPNRFAELSKWLLDEKKLMPVWVGTKEEEEQILASIALGGAGKVWISGETSPASTSLLAFYSFIERSALYVGNESGPLQMADIAEIPTVGIFGPGVPNVFYPRSTKSIVLHEVLSCNPCNQKICVQPLDRCIDRISFTQVKLGINQVLGLLNV